MAMMLAQRDGSCGKEVANATVTIAHSRTADLGEICRTADCLIAAVGVPEMIRGDMIRDGAVDEKTIFVLVRDIVDALHEIHQKAVIHRDDEILVPSDP